MHKGLLIVLFVVASSIGAEAQSLKDMLYGGKLKMDSNAVLRKTDDYKARLDTVQKKPAPDTVKVVVAATPVANATLVDSVKKTTTEEVVSPAVEGEPVAATVAAAPAKSNTRLWKEYTDALATDLKAEVLNSKKIKKETYYITVGYELGEDGKVTVTNVAATPANNLIEDQVKQRMEINPLQLAPVLDSNGKPRKMKRSYNFSVTKD